MLLTFSRFAGLLLASFFLMACAPSDSASSPTLRSLALSSGELTPSFSGSTTQYKAYVGTEVERVEVLAYAHNSEANVSINELEATRGSDATEVQLAATSDTIITVTVTSQDANAEMTYFVTLLREEPPTDHTAPEAVSNEEETTNDPATGSEDSDTPSGSDDDGPLSQDDTAANVQSVIAWQASQHIKANEVQSNARFGSSLAANSQYLVVGSPTADTRQGRVDVYQRDGAQWSWRQTLKGLSAIDGEFGRQVAMDEQHLIISQPGENRIYSYTLEQGRFTETSTFRVTLANSNDRFGQSLALDGTTLAVSNLRSQSVNGEVRIYQLIGGFWLQEAALRDDELGGFDAYTHALALQNGLLAVGSFGDDNQCRGNTRDAGSVRLYQRQGTNWNEQTAIRASDGDGGDRFGYSVAIHNDTLVVGAQCEDGPINTQTSRGAAYVFTRDGSDWNQTAKLSASDGAAHSLFGDKLTVLDQQIIVGASYESSNGLAASGAAYVFNHENGQWRQTDILRASNSGSFDRFGWGMTNNSDTLFIAAPQEDSPSPYDGHLNTNNLSGSVYSYQ